MKYHFIEAALRQLSKSLDMPLAEIVGEGRTNIQARARMAVMFVANRKMHISHEEIGYRIGRDRTTSIHGVHKALQLLRDRDPIMLRCYRIVIRYYAAVRQRDRKQRAQSRAFEMRRSAMALPPVPAGQGERHEDHQAA